MWGIHRWPVNSPHKWPVTRKMFPFDDVIMWGLWVSTAIPVPMIPNGLIDSHHLYWLTLVNKCGVDAMIKLGQYSSNKHYSIFLGRVMYLSGTEWPRISMSWSKAILTCYQCIRPIKWYSLEIELAHCGLVTLYAVVINSCDGNGGGVTSVWC